MIGCGLRELAAGFSLEIVDTKTDNGVKDRLTNVSVKLKRTPGLAQFLMDQSIQFGQ